MRADRLLLAPLCAFVAASCGVADPSVQVAASHGSAAVVQALADGYEERFPGRPVQLQFDDGVALVAAVAAGSTAPDLLVLDDAALFGDVLEPAWTDFHLRFGRDRMVLARTAGMALDAALAGTPQTAAEPGFAAALSNPAYPVLFADPALSATGYHSLATLRLLDAGGETTLEADLAAAIASGLSLPALIATAVATPTLTLLPYSVAAAAGLEPSELAEAINLGEPHLGPLYARATIEAAGTPRRPATVIHFGVSVPAEGPRRAAALDLLRFLLGRDGVALTAQAGLEPVRGEERLVGFGVPADVEELLAATTAR